MILNPVLWSGIFLYKENHFQIFSNSILFREAYQHIRKRKKQMERYWLQYDIATLNRNCCICIEKNHFIASNHRKLSSGRIMGLRSSIVPTDYLEQENKLDVDCSFIAFLCRI